VKRERLFDAAPVGRGPRSSCKELVPLPRRACLRCGGATVETVVAQPALLRHGGYGATREVTRLACVDPACAAVRVARVDEVKPAPPLFPKEQEK
jgi:hypothetical protein